MGAGPKSRAFLTSPAAFCRIDVLTSTTFVRDHIDDQTLYCANAASVEMDSTHEPP